jgi:hypothetical protein
MYDNDDDDGDGGCCVLCPIRKRKMIVFVTLIFFCSPIGSKQRDLDDFVNIIGTVPKHHEHFYVYYRTILYRCVSLSSTTGIGGAQTTRVIPMEDE